MALVSDRRRLLDAVPDGPLDHHAALVRDLLGCDAALVTVLDDDDQRFLGLTGFDGPIAAARGTPLDQSLCRHVAAGATPLRFVDLTDDPRVPPLPDGTPMGMTAYLGVPLTAPDREVIGAVCALERAPRDWSADDLARLEVVRDMVQTELRLVVESRRHRARTEEVSLLLSTLRHELGGQLAIVLGGLETSLLPGIDEELRDRVLRNARRDCRSVISTLDALLRVDSRAPAQLQEVDVARLAEDAVQVVAEAHATERILLRAESVTIVTEGTLLQHVVRNLVDNACKYGQGAVRVTVAASGDGVTVTVADRGPGMPDEVLDQLYTPFSRERDDGGASGFGLGLYIVRTLCQRLGAELDVATSPDGTTITVTAPDRRQSPKPSKAASRSDGA